MARFLITLAGCLLTTLAFSHEEAAKEEFFLSTPEQVAALSSEPNYLKGLTTLSWMRRRSLDRQLSPLARALLADTYREFPA